MPGVAAGIAVLAGIAAADAICGVRLREIHRGDDHRAAATLLSRATPDGAKLAATFKRLIDVKDAAPTSNGSPQHSICREDTQTTAFTTSA